MEESSAATLQRHTRSKTLESIKIATTPISQLAEDIVLGIQAAINDQTMTHPNSPPSMFPL